MPLLIPHSSPLIDSTDVKAVVDVLQSAYLSCGKQVHLFEKKLSQMIGQPAAVAVSSGSAALHMALRVLNIKPRDKVAVPAYTCSALLNVIYYLQAEPLIVDVCYDDGNLDPEDLKRRISVKVKAVIVPHMFGQAAALDKILALGVPVIEDCAQAIGTRYQGKMVGSFGVLSVFSFYATKVITTMAGGAVVSRDQRLIERIRDLVDYDKKKTYKVRYNYAMSDVQAALGTSQLKKLPQIIQQRQRIASRYSQSFNQLPIILPQDSKHSKHTFYRYVIKLKRYKTKICKRLKALGIEVADPVYKPLHRYLNQSNFPVTDLLMRQNVSIPIYPSLRDEKRRYIIQKVLEVVGE